MEVEEWKSVESERTAPKPNPAMASIGVSDGPRLGEMSEGARDGAREGVRFPEIDGGGRAIDVASLFGLMDAFGFEE